MPHIEPHEAFDAYKAEFDANPYHQSLGITVLERRPGYGRIVLRKDENTPGGIGGSVHGGVLAAMVDIAMLVAIFAEQREGEVPAGTAELSIELKYYEGQPVIQEIQRVSKPGRRVYSSVKTMPVVRNGLGISIVSTPKGVMSDNAARENNVGGEILCRVF